MNPIDTIKPFLRYWIGAALIVGALFLFLGQQTPSSGASLAPVPVVLKQEIKPNQLSPLVQIGKTKIPVEIATSSAAVKKGLSGRNSLDTDKGMLFIFAQADRYRFWMPTMHFPIDIIWINNNEVIDADENVSPRFDALHPLFYTPASPVQYVLEVNAGFMRRNNISLGDPVIFHHRR